MSYSFIPLIEDELCYIEKMESSRMAVEGEEVKNSIRVFRGFQNNFVIPALSFSGSIQSFFVSSIYTSDNHHQTTLQARNQLFYLYLKMFCSASFEHIQKTYSLSILHNLNPLSEQRIVAGNHLQSLSAYRQFSCRI